MALSPHYATDEELEAARLALEAEEEQAKKEVAKQEADQLHIWIVILVEGCL